MVAWPGVIKHSDDPEVIFVSGQDEWDSDADLRQFEYDEADFLVDSTGKKYKLTSSRNGYVEPEPRDDSMTLQQFLGLVKAHAASKGSCCVAKIYAPTFHEAFKIIESLK